VGELTILWTILAALVSEGDAGSPLAKAVRIWVRSHRHALGLTQARLGWRALSVLAEERRLLVAQDEAEIFATVTAIAEAVQLDDFNARLLGAVVAIDRLPLLSDIKPLLTEHKVDLLAHCGAVAGAPLREAAKRVRHSDLIRLGLVRLTTTKAGALMVDPSWTLDKLLDRSAGNEAAIIEALVGRKQAATLDLSAFGHVAAAVDLIVRLVRGSMDARASGINILLYGPPGTGKTELAKTIAAQAAAALYSVGEADEDGEEPSRWDRVTAYRLSQRIVARRSKMVLLFDEMEDLIGAARPSDDDYYSSRDGSKIFVNRMLETNAVPTIWTTNAIGNVDPAILRRMSYVLKLDYPTAHAAHALVTRISVDELVPLAGASIAALTEQAPETTTVARTAARAARLGGHDGDAVAVATSLVCALRGGKALRLDQAQRGVIDLGLYEAREDIGRLFDRLADPATPSDYSLLLTGPPGTGKTALAHHLAKRLDRPLIVKRTSDLFSKWVGETEQQIADAFAEAIAKDGVLLFDEVDSLLADRATARASWEVTQVNELLTWFDSHPLPFIAATNHAGKLDPAAMRRFVFKLDLRPLSAEKAATAYARFFGHPAPAALNGFHGITPGDLAVVARQLRYVTDPVKPADIVTRIAAELAVKPEAGQRIGF
jgi:transitional endoplasmic reticulum ATPase